jgi:hypothetical protein
MSGDPVDPATKALEAERDAVEISPAQPADSDRIDAPVTGAVETGEPAHVKHDHPGRMKH